MQVPPPQRGGAINLSKLDLYKSDTKVLRSKTQRSITFPLWGIPPMFIRAFGRG